MKRSMDLIREMLMCIENDENVFDIESDDDVGYNLQLLYDAGYLLTKENFDVICSVRSSELVQLSWSGCEYLDSIRDDGVWASVRDKVKPFGSIAFELVKALAIDYMKQKIGLSA